MSLLCYLKKDAYARIASCANGFGKMHGPTNLGLSSDAQGYYITVPHDLFQEPDFAIRDDLDSDIERYSAKIEVDMPVYTNDALQTGNYDVGDPEVRLVVSRKIVNREGVLHREMTVRAPTLEKIQETIRKIRRGEITPAGREMTVLEEQVMETERANSRNRNSVAIIDSVRAELRDAQVSFTRDELLLSHLDGILCGENREGPVDRISRNYRVQAKAIRVTDELAAIKAMRWYKIGRFFSDLINSRRDLRS